MCDFSYHCFILGSDLSYLDNYDGGYQDTLWRYSWCAITPSRKSLADDYTLAICPGICNSSESVYIRRVVHQAQFRGYRVAVLNHVGALKCVPVTSHRIFSYGCTKDYGGMLDDLEKRYPGTKFILVGFSMGGNLVTKYIGEERKRPDNIIAGVSACQGYDAAKYVNDNINKDKHTTCDEMRKQC